MLRVNGCVAPVGAVRGLLLAAALVLVGCGEEEPCAEVRCDFGVCDAASGECVNEEECRLEEDCLPGYTCDDYRCEPVDECSADGDCDTGVCREGACVNPQRCDSNDECLERTYCSEEGRCAYDPCNAVRCPRGVCERGTGECVSEQRCTRKTERLDCAEGEKCADGRCEPEERFCEELACERGECSFEAGGCVNPDDCDGEDANCREGYHCDDRDRCAPDPCEEYDVECENGGVCVPGVGKCENPDRCESDSECVEEHVCIDGTCRLEEAVCGDGDGDGGCRGRQRCEIDGQSAECVEPERCETSFDCLEGRQCDGRQCREAISCREDAFEPNDGPDEAVDFTEAAIDGTVGATLCESDDVYRVDSSELSDGESDEVLVVEVRMPERVQGLGELELTLVGSGGEESSASTGRMGERGRARVEDELAAGAKRGEYRVEVTGEGGSEAGVYYELGAEMESPHARQRCDDAPRMRPGERVTGNTERADGGAFESSCGGGSDGGELVYEIEVDEAREVSFEVEPALSSTDLALSLRERCASPADELACVDRYGPGAGETLDALLEPGRYHLIVEGIGDEGGGPFEVSSETTRVACTPGDDYCESSDTARRCVDDGSREISVECQGRCSPALGRCVSPEGDRCSEATVVDATDRSAAGTEIVAERIDLLEYADRSRLSEQSCLGAQADQTSGPDKVYRIDLAPQMTFEATAIFPDEVDEGVLYVLDDCSGSDDACRESTVSPHDGPTRRSLEYGNTGDDEESVYLVVDAPAGLSEGETYVDIELREQTCEPGAYRCRNQDASAPHFEYSERCDEYGLGWEHFEECGAWGCWEDEGWCAQPDECWRALDISSQARAGAADFVFNWVDFGDDFDATACGMPAQQVDGDDAVFRFDMTSGERLKATLDRSSCCFNPSLQILDDCGADSAQCLASVREEADNAAVSYDATDDETVYLVVDNDRMSSSDESRLQAKIMEPCTDEGARRCADDDTLQICTEGYWEPFDCSNGCQESACASPEGHACHDPIDATEDADDPDGVTYTEDFRDFKNDFSDLNCHDDGQDLGADQVYRVDLAGGETLEASLDLSQWTPATVAIVTDCQEAADSCADGDYDAPAEASYTAENDETVYVIADSYGSGGDFTLNLNVD